MPNARALHHNYMQEAIDRIDLKQLCVWILTGGTTEPTDLNYNDRLVDGCSKIKELINTTFTDKEENNTAHDYLSDAIGAYADVYVEIGVQIGAHLITQILNNKTALTN